VPARRRSAVADAVLARGAPGGGREDIEAVAADCLAAVHAPSVSTAAHTVKG